MPNPVLVENKFLMLTIKSKGYQSCPFSGCKECGSDDYSILNINNEKSCKFSDLVIHLIRDHEFFEGDVEYRVDPQAAVDCLELQPGIDYSPRYSIVEEKVWTFQRSKFVPNGTHNESYKSLKELNVCYKIIDDILLLISEEEYNKPLIIDGYTVHNTFQGCWKYKRQIINRKIIID